MKLRNLCIVVLLALGLFGSSVATASADGGVTTNGVLWCKDCK